MKTQNQVRITNENIRITGENVQHIGECIALSAINKMIRFAHHPRSLDKRYAGLVEDIYHSKGYNTTFSDGYDLASSTSYPSPRPLIKSLPDFLKNRNGTSRNTPC